MANCRIVNQSMIDAVEKVSGISTSYKTAGEEFIKQLNTAIAEMEGASKDALSKYINSSINTFVATDLPQAVKGMSDVLEVNRSNFESVDQQIADSIGGEN